MNYSFTATSRAEVIQEAKKILKARLRKTMCLTTPDAVRELVRDYLAVHLAAKYSEIFFVMYLDAQYRHIASEEVFTGTIDGCSVYPREIARRILAHNAAAVILAHNHPSGESAASEADKRITKRLQDTLELLDVRVIDHMIVTGDRVLSFAEESLL